jgi:hypothetical protein
MGETSYSLQQNREFFCGEIQVHHFLNKPFIMKNYFIGFLLTSFMLVSLNLSAQLKIEESPRQLIPTSHLYLDVHQMEPGKVDFKGVAQAHAKDLATQGKYQVQFLKFWVDEAQGKVYCLASAPDAESLRKTHAEAHGLLPRNIYEVREGLERELKGKKDLYLDVHYLGAGKATAADVAKAHEKDLAVQKKYGVNLINYWFDEKEGVVMCLAQAKDSNALIQTHKEAHGLLPARVSKVKEGN